MWHRLHVSVTYLFKTVLVSVVVKNHSGALDHHQQKIVHA
jgi:hypothetical protein